MGYQGFNTFVCSSFLSAPPFFVPREHRWGHHQEKYGVTIFAVVTKFDNCFRGT